MPDDEKALVEAVISRVKQAEGLRFDTDVAGVLGAEKKNVGQWKARGTVPWDRLVDYCTSRGVSLDWVITGRGSMRADESVVQEPGAIYRVRTDQDAVYAISADLYRALQDQGIHLTGEQFADAVKMLHRDMLLMQADSIPREKIRALVALLGARAG